MVTYRKGEVMEYLFIFTYTVILAVMAGLLLGAIFALFSKQNKLKRFQIVFGYSSLVLMLIINLYIILNNS